MRKLTSFVVAMLAVPFICTAQVPENLDRMEDQAYAQLQQEIGRARVKNMASVSWQMDRVLNIRVFLCDGKKITMKSFTGKRDGKNEFDGKWITNPDFNVDGDNVVACSWIDEEDNKAFIRLYVGGDDRKISEHCYEGKADLKPDEKDAGVWTIGKKAFRGETASVDVTMRRRKHVINLFTANRNAKRLKFYTQREGQDWKEVELDD